MPKVERIDPEEDAERVPLPEKMKVVHGGTGVRFHLPNEGRPSCDRAGMLEDAELTELTVKEAREGWSLSACRKCFRETREFGEELFPQTVLVAMSESGQASAYHRPDPTADKDVPECGYWRGGRPDYDPVFVEVPRYKIRDRLDPCKGCFRWFRRRDVCWLCGEERAGSMEDHLPKCPAVVLEDPGR